MAFDPVSAVFDIGGKLIDRLWPNPVERDAAKLKLFELQQTGELAKLAAETELAKGQLEINKVEAASPLTFISGWRPAVGWVCVAGLFMQYIFSPFFSWGSRLVGHPVDLPELDLSTMTPLLFGMLGLGAMRTVEKVNQVASK